jgi:hypothetical protein
VDERLDELEKLDERVRAGRYESPGSDAYSDVLHRL